MLVGRLHAGWCAAVAAGLLFPFITGNPYHLTVMGNVYIFALATLGLNLLTGYTGQFNLAHSGFMAIGAYTVGILTVDHRWPFWSAFVMSGVVPVLVGCVVGPLSLRLKGHFFTIFTMCVGAIVHLTIEKWDDLTKGPVGIMGIARPGTIPTPFGSVAFDTPLSMYYLLFAFFVVGSWLMHRIVHSLLGYTFVAIRNGDALAEALGIDLMRTKLTAFLLSVAYAGVAGGLYAGFVRFLSPDLAGLDRTFDMTASMLVGGMGTLAGPLVGAVVMAWLGQALQAIADYRFLVFGPLLIVLVVFMPAGIVGAWNVRRLRRRSPAHRSRPTDAPVTRLQEDARA